MLQAKLGILRWPRLAGRTQANRTEEEKNNRDKRGAMKPKRTSGAKGKKATWERWKVGLTQSGSLSLLLALRAGSRALGYWEVVCSSNFSL